MHFPPEFARIDPTLCLLDDHRLAHAALSEAVNHLFCGHTHLAREYDLPNHPGVRVYCAGTATQYCAPNKNQIHLTEIDVSSGAISAVHRTDLTWDPNLQDFV
jgi:predicted phosphodiesterase